MNTFTIHNLIGFMVTGSLAVQFYIVYFKSGRNLLDLLSANFIGCAAGICMCSFLTDNLVPSGMSAWGWPGGPTTGQLAAWTLVIHRFAYVFALLLMVTKLHFVLYYCEYRNFLRRHIYIVYVVTFMVIPLLWTSLCLVVPDAPAANTSSWQTALPWMPNVGPVMVPLMLCWAACESYSVILLWRTRRPSASSLAGSRMNHRMIFLAFVVQVLIGFADMVFSFVGYAGVALLPLGSTIMGILLAVALTRMRMEADRTRQQLEREKAALLESVQQPLMYFNKDLHMQWANCEATRFAGIGTDTLQGSHIKDVLGNLGRNEYLPVELAIETGQSHRREIVRSDGSTWIVHASPILGGNSQALGVVVLMMDITQIRLAEEMLRNAHSKILAVREEERCRVAKDLHDSVAQSLAALEMRLRAGVAGLGVESASKEIGALADRCSDLTREVRQICHDLYPAALELLGLTRAMNEILDQYNAAGKKCEIRCPEHLRRARFSRDIEIALFRFVQEAVNNATKHGQAEKIEISMEYESGELVLRVTDNGVGFDPEDISGRGIGISSIRGRVEGVGGHLGINSSPGHTVLQVRVPCNTIVTNADPGSEPGGRLLGGSTTVDTAS